MAARVLECDRGRTLDSLREELGRGSPLLLGVRTRPETEARRFGSSAARRSRMLRELIVAAVAVGRVWLLNPSRLNVAVKTLERDAACSGWSGVT